MKKGVSLDVFGPGGGRRHGGGGERELSVGSVSLLHPLPCEDASAPVRRWGCSHA